MVCLTMDEMYKYCKLLIGKHSSAVVDYLKLNYMYQYQLNKVRVWIAHALTSASAVSGHWRSSIVGIQDASTRKSASNDFHLCRNELRDQCHAYGRPLIALAESV